MSNIVNFSTTESVEDIKAAGEHYGIQFDIETIGTGIATEEEAAAAAAEPAEEKPAEETDTSKPNEGEGEAEVKPAEPEAEAKPKSELEPDEQADEKPHKKLLRQVDKLTGRAKTAEQALETERARVAELERKLAGNKEPEPVKAVEDDTPKRPQRPSRPKLEQFEFDQEKLEAALDKFETETIPAYEDALSEFTRKETIRELTAQQETARQKQAEEKAESEWQEAISAREGLKDKLAEATDVKISSAMDVTLKSIFKPADRALILEHFVDNPEEAEAMMGETISEKEKPTRGDWEYLTNRATMLLTELKVKLKSGKPAAKAPEKVTPVPPAKPKPPVSAAPAPIDPVTGNNNSTGTDLESANTETYLAQRAAQRNERNKRQFAR